MKKMIAAFGLVAAILATGCVSTALPPVDRRVTIAEDLGTTVFVTDVRCAKGKSSYATFQANVVNNTSRDLGVASTDSRPPTSMAAPTAARRRRA